MRKGWLTGGTRLGADIDEEIARLATAAGQKALVGEPVAAELERIEALRQVRTSLPPIPSNSLLVVGGVAFVCLVIVSLAWSVRMPTTRVQLMVKTTQATLILAEPLRWSGDLHLAPAPVRLQRARRIDLPPEFAPPAPPDTMAWLDFTVTEGHAGLRLLRIEREATVTFALVEAGAVVVATRGTVSGEVDASGVVSGRVGSTPGAEWRLDKTQFDGPPALFGFVADRTGAAPSELRFTPAQPLVLRNVAIRGLGLMQERVEVDQRPAFVSALRSGTLTLADTGEKLTIEEDAPLRLTGASGVVTTLQIGGDAIALTFEGSVSGITLGGGDFARNLKPSVLEHLFHQERLGFLWAAVTFLWGLFWSGRKLLSHGKAAD